MADENNNNSGSGSAGGDVGGVTGGGSNGSGQGASSGQNSGGNVGATGGGQGSGVTAGATSDWRESLPEDIRGEASFGPIQSVESLARSYLHSQKLIGRDKVPVPTANSSDAEWDAFYAKAGRPDSADKYDVNIKDLGDEGNKGLKEVAFKAGLSPKQLKSIVDWSESNYAAQLESHKSSQEVKIKQQTEEFTKKLGGPEHYKAAVERANQALTFTAKPELAKFLKDSGLGQDPMFIEYFDSLAKRMKEDGMKGNGGENFGSAIDEIQSQIKSFESHPAYYNTAHDQHKDIRNKTHALRERMHQLSQPRQ